MRRGALWEMDKDGSHPFNHSRLALLHHPGPARVLDRCVFLAYILGKWLRFMTNALLTLKYNPRLLTLSHRYCLHLPHCRQMVQYLVHSNWILFSTFTSKWPGSDIGICSCWRSAIKPTQPISVSRPEWAETATLGLFKLGSPFISWFLLSLLTSSPISRITKATPSSKMLADTNAKSGWLQGSATLSSCRSSVIYQDLFRMNVGDLLKCFPIKL